jgi:hypothetical protein
MKPGYWIGILALAGAIIGYALYDWTGWYGAMSGTVIGILLGVVVYSVLKSRNKPS